MVKLVVLSKIIYTKCLKLNFLSSFERILKIGYYLTKLLSKVDCLRFLGHRVSLAICKVALLAA